MFNDIALIKLDKIAPFNDAIQRKEFEREVTAELTTAYLNSIQEHVGKMEM